MPTTLKLLGNVKNKKLLDIGCGTGIYAKTLTEKGAKVRGIDISEEMIKIARQESPNIEFKLGSMDKLPYRNNEFDIVLAALSLGYLEDWGEVLKEIKRVLKPKGLFVFSTDNPIIESAKKVIYKGKKFRVVTDYFKEGLRKQSWFIMRFKSKNKLPIKSKRYTSMPYHHKTYGTIVKDIVSNGFEILDYEDSYPLLKSKNIFPEDYKLCTNMPYFCTWKVRRK